MARQANNSNFLTYSTKLMAATDDAFAYILGRAKMREKAFRSAVDAKGKGALTTYPEITPELIRIYEDDFYRQIFDANGNIIDEATKFARKEVTLTKELRGMAAGLNSVFQANPWAKPFFLIARTGVNGLELTAKHTPGFNFLVKEWNDIAFATNRTLERGDLAQYGITTLEELANAKALQVGRLAMGSSLIFMANQAWMRGELTGNGPADASMKKMWIDSGWSPRSINIGGTWVSYDAMEPFNLVLANIADVGDNMELMGPQFAEERLQLVVAALGKGATSKTYLQGIGQLFDLLSGDAGYASQKILANLVNNQVPLAGLSAEIGNVLSPNMRELDSSFWSHIANRNPGLKLTQPIKYDMLNGQPIRPWNFFEAAFNAVSPVQLRMDKGAGRQLLYNSNYDTRVLAYSAPDGTSLRRSPQARSLFQKAIGDTNLEEALNQLANRPDVQASIRAMEEDLKAGRTQLDPMKAYLHNRLIKLLIRKHTKLAWASLRDNPIIIDLKMTQQNLKLNNIGRYQDTLLNIPK